MKTGDIFRHNLRSTREAKGITQKSLALKVGLNDQAIRDYEAGRRFPPVETMGQIADALAVKVSDLFESSEPAPVLQVPVSKALQKLLAIPDKIYEMAQEIDLDDEAWDTVESALKIAKEIKDSKKSSKKQG